MGLFDALKSFADSVNTEYDRRIRGASLVEEYDPTGASHHGAHGAHDTHHDTHVERIEGEGGAVGHLQSNAGPQLQNDPVAAEVTHR
jgi:hypothetical protein